MIQRLRRWLHREPAELDPSKLNDGDYLMAMRRGQVEAAVELENSDYREKVRRRTYG